MKNTLFAFLFCSLFAQHLLAQCPISVFQNPANIASPQPLLSHFMSAKRDSAASKPYLYVAAKAKGLFIYNLSNLNLPTLSASIAASAFANLDVNSITQSGNYIYLALGDIFNASSQKSGMAIVDVSNPPNPVVKSVFSFTANSGAGSVAVDGNYAYLAAMQNGILVLDISNKSSIQFVSQAKPNVNFPVANPSSSDLLKINARNVVVKNNVLYLCYDAGGIRVLNAGNKNALSETGRYSNTLLNNRPRAYNNLALNDTLAYVATDYCGMEILNLKDTAAIKRIGWWNPWKCETTGNTWFNSPGHTNELEFDPLCKTVFMSAGRSDLMAVNVSNPLAPDSCSQFGLKTDSVGTWGLGRYKNQIYLAYISTWPLYTPFRSEWSGIKIVTYNNACSTGLNNIASNTGILVYPNPAGQKLYIQHTNTNVQIYLYSADGKLIAATEGGVSDNTTVVDTKTLSRGLYLLRIETPGGTRFDKVILTD